jgi:penicillin-insensitive murein endopeptidase
VKLTPIALTLLGLCLAAAPADAAAPRKRAQRAKLTNTNSRMRSGTPGHVEEAPPKVKAESVGSPNEGHLTNGVHLDTKHEYLHVVPTYSSGDLRWGLPELVNMIDRSAKTVNKRFSGAVLDVGDLSKKGGGDVSRHHSHESGRDADLGFYSIDAHGRQVHAAGFVKYETGTLDSTNVPGAHFDLPRNWLFVQTLLTDPVAHVSHIFIAAPLREKLLVYAKTHGVSRALLDRAAMVMMQPHHSLPHDDHIHVRISCPASMRGTCVELAKGALGESHHAGRVAKKGVKTPPHAAQKPKPAARHDAPPAASIVMDRDDNDADSDIDTDVKNAVDDEGVVRITD